MSWENISAWLVKIAIAYACYFAVVSVIFVIVLVIFCLVQSRHDKRGGEHEGAE